LTFLPLVRIEGHVLVELVALTSRLRVPVALRPGALTCVLTLSVLPSLREDNSLGRQVGTGDIPRIQPDGLSVLRVAAPPSWMLVSAARQSITYGLSHLVEGHFDTWTTKRAEVALQAFVLFALHHENILLAITRGDKPSNVRHRKSHQGPGRCYLCHAAARNWILNATLSNTNYFV
jgi:hypothetical protein